MVLSFMFIGIIGAQGQSNVSGVVTDSEGGDPLPGVNVVVQGTTSGTVTDIDGKYSLAASSTDILVFSYIGYSAQEVAINNRAVVDTQLIVDVQSLQEVVVTAFGLEREKKSLTYAAQSVNTDEISEARSLNVANALSGKVSGISVLRSGQGVGSPSRVILRGNRSVDGNSQPLYIVDGVPIIGDLTDINPDDVAGVSVLKGPNAAALYGNRANNGAIIITTKSGGEEGSFRVSVGTTYMTESAILLQDYQNEFGQGNTGIYDATSEQSWGPRLDGSQVAHWSPDPNFGTSTYAYEAQPDNVKDFFQTGHNLATNLTIGANNGTTKTYFSYTFTDAAGIVPGNDLQRHNASLRLTNKLSERLTLDTKLSYSKEEIANRLITDEGKDNPIRHIFRIPRNVRTEDASIFEYTDANEANRQHYWIPDINGGANPYWTANRNLRPLNTDRVIAFASLKYKLTDDLSISVRSAADRIFENEEVKYYNDSYVIASNGIYEINNSQALEWNNDFLISYQKQVNPDWFISANFGGNSRKERNGGTSTRIDRGDGLITPNLFDFGNSQRVVANNFVGPAVPGGRGAPRLVIGPRDVNSIYAFAQVGFKNAVFLDLTARNDWSSTLPADNRSFLYPSIGLNTVISDLTTLPDFVTFVKVRASYAQVGNDARAFQTIRTAGITPGGNNGFVQFSKTVPNAELKPEKTNSIEIGTDLRFLDNRIGLDLTYYKSNTKDQLIPRNVALGDGFTQFFQNAGDVENKGIEAFLSVTPVSTQDFTWDLTFNFTRNRSKVVKIADDNPSITVNQNFAREFRIVQGQPWGEVYSRGFARDGQGRVIVETNGIPRITDGLEVPVANFNPDWLGGIRNSFTYKNINLSFLIDIRSGGSLVSFTDAVVAADGHTKKTLDGRDGSLVFGENVFANETAVQEGGATNNVSVDAETFWKAVGGRNAPVGEAFALNASNVRLRELVLGYSLPQSVLANMPFKGLKISFVGRNLFFISNSAGTIDPEVSISTLKQVEGFESFALPTSRSLGFNVKFDF